MNAGSFARLQANNFTSYAIYLSNNNIFAIYLYAFDGIEGGVTILDLDNNKLRTLPNVLRKLTSLSTLYLRQNPLISLASPAILPISRSVRSLAISLDLFSEWPEELHYFRLLSELYVDGYKQQSLPLNALSGMENTLTVLELTRSAMDRIPSAICHLNGLRNLSFTSNPLTNTPIFEPCRESRSSVIYLSLRNNSLHNFPSVFSSFNALEILDVSENFIRTIDSSVIPEKHPLEYLDLSSNQFYRIPLAVTYLKELYFLDLSYNQITSIEDFDFVDMTNLRTLLITNNPLEYVSTDAFQSQAAFDLLNFSNTDLVDIPRAVLSLSSVQNLDLQGAPLDCTCNMFYFDNSTVHVGTLTGTCAGTGENITYFRQQFLLYCPRTFTLF